MKIIFESKRLLNEVTMEQAEARFNSRAFNNAFNSYFSMSGAVINLPKEAVINRINDSVPSDIAERYKPEALWWVINVAIKLASKGDSRYWGNSAETKHLETFFQIKEAGKTSILSRKDLNKIEGWGELAEVIIQARPAWKAYNKLKMSMDAEAGTNVIYEDDDWTVIIPETKGAACELGKDTDWCTRSPGLPYYDNYHKKEDPLIIFISKEDPVERYQFHYGTNQFMDKEDRTIIKKEIFFILNEIVKKLASELPTFVNEKAAKYHEYEKLDNGGYKTIVVNEIQFFNNEEQLHRLDGPALINPNRKSWYQNGKLHREEDPAIEYANGTKEWYQNGKRHRTDGPAIEWVNGEKEWYQNGQRHRTDGPAVERPDNTKGWYQNGLLHRLDGPAVEHPNGKTVWFLKGNQITEEEFNQRTKRKRLKELFVRYL